MEPDDDLKGRVDALRKAGRYAEAANLCLQAGEPRRASELYAAVWDWPNAIAVAEENDLYALAYAHALAGEDRQALARLMRLRCARGLHETLLARGVDIVIDRRLVIVALVALAHSIVRVNLHADSR